MDDNGCTASASVLAGLHRRGYRPGAAGAALKSLAAALIQMSGWQPDQMFYDPLWFRRTLVL
jgi:putative N6-adenine-specific DNA methylase